jgi:hypothetical protein
MAADVVAQVVPDAQRVGAIRLKASGRLEDFVLIEPEKT